MPLYGSPRRALASTPGNRPVGRAARHRYVSCLFTSPFPSRPTTTPGRRFSYHRLLYLAAPFLLPVVLLAPLRVAAVIAIAAFLAWWLADSMHREGM
ncbi:MAG TPA: hypothetical protein VGR27_00685 [Longimicrobiaceae bacterium]|nr:hypothetical protein [Longimicrobiaceae bacterium]